VLLLSLGLAHGSAVAQDSAAAQSAAPAQSTAPAQNAASPQLPASAQNSTAAQSATAHATDKSPAPPPLTWNPSWPRFRPVGYGLTAAAVGGALAATFLIPYPEDPRWTGGILFDDAIRNALRAHNPNTRDAIRLASDITLATTLVHEAIVDSILIPLSDQSPEVAWQLTLMNAQALSLNILLATVLFKVAARARPSYQQCTSDSSFDPLCKTGTYASFPSSHASTAFTAAGLSCVHHQFLPIYGGGPWDTTACVGSLVLATATGMFRIIGDRHYATDVIVGSAMGFSLGYIYPWLLHYRNTGADTTSAAADRAAMHWGVIPGAGGAGPYGMSVAGIF
jgi:membrane-associated phospholipid phosphatase